MMDITPGKPISVPCRHCGKMMPFSVALGNYTLKCLACSRSTRISVKSESGEVRLTTSAEKPDQTPA
jgi:hypothetical protein